MWFQKCQTSFEDVRISQSRVSGIQGGRLRLRVSQRRRTWLGVERVRGHRRRTSFTSTLPTPRHRHYYGSVGIVVSSRYRDRTYRQGFWSACDFVRGYPMQFSTPETLRSESPGPNHRNNLPDFLGRTRRRCTPGHSTTADTRCPGPRGLDVRGTGA